MKINQRYDAVLDPKEHAKAVPHHIFDEMRQNDPVAFHGEIDGQNVWSATKMKDIRKISRDVKTFSSARGTVFPNVRSRWERTTGPIADMAFSDPPQHTRLRGFAARAFSPSVMRKNQHWIEEVVNLVLDRAEEEAELDIVSNISAQLPSRVITKFLGVPLDEQDWVITESTKTFSSSNPAIGPAGALAARQEILDYALHLKKIRLANPSEDMTSQLAHAEADGTPITDEEFSNTFLALLTAGFETTHSLITHSLLYFTENPELLNQMRNASEREWTFAVEELLRTNAPISHMARTVTQETEVSGQILAPGDYLITWFAAANHDPEEFENPYLVDFNRKPAHVSFGGGGPHLCLGNQLARLETRTILSKFAERNLKLELTEKPTRAENVFLNVVTSAKAKWL